MRNTLTLVYPPISNQEAYWLKKVAEFEGQIRTSDFYAIGKREEAKFHFEWADEGSTIEDGVVQLSKSVQSLQDGFIPVSISTASGLCDNFSLDVAVLAQASTGGVPDRINIVCGEKIIKLYDAKFDESTTEPFAWFTTEKLIWERSWGRPGIVGLDSYRKFATYKLLYIGIAKVRDTFERLIKSAHDARQDILSNEDSSGGRVTDEVILFPLTVRAQTVMRDITPALSDEEDENEEFYFYQQRDLAKEAKDIVIDAEKALVSLLQPPYNGTKFDNFPTKRVPSEGLRRHGYTNYTFELGENITLEGDKIDLRGCRHLEKADQVVVSNTKVELRVASS